MGTEGAVGNFVVQKNVGFWNLGERNGQIGFGLAAMVLLLNYFGWGIYFYGGVE